MSRFVRNLLKSGIKVERRYTARGRTGLGGSTTTFRAEFPLPSFIGALEKKERIVLFSSARYAMRTYRSQLRRKAPDKYTKRGRVKKRYREEVIDKALRPPYFRTGILYRSIDFYVDMNRGRFDSGPPHISGLDKFTKSKQSVPGLLNEGGPAMVRVGSKKKRTWRWEQRQYRPFPYQGLVFTFTQAFFKRKLRETPLQL